MLPKKSILVVDDEPDYLVLLRRRLEEGRYRVRTANNGREALEEIRRERPDVVLLDIQMPEMDGLKVLEKIRCSDKRLPVFILTAFPNAERFGAARRKNASGFIVKTGDLSRQVKNITNTLKLSAKYRANRP